MLIIGPERLMSVKMGPLHSMFCYYTQSAKSRIITNESRIIMNESRIMTNGIRGWLARIGENPCRFQGRSPLLGFLFFQQQRNMGQNFPSAPSVRGQIFSGALRRTTREGGSPPSSILKGVPTGAFQTRWSTPRRPRPCLLAWPGLGAGFTAWAPGSFARRQVRIEKLN